MLATPLAVPFQAAQYKVQRRRRSKQSRDVGCGSKSPCTWYLCLVSSKPATCDEPAMIQTFPSRTVLTRSINANVCVVEAIFMLAQCDKQRLGLRSFINLLGTFSEMPSFGIVPIARTPPLLVHASTCGPIGLARLWMLNHLVDGIGCSHVLLELPVANQSQTLACLQSYSESICSFDR